jgi:hypothetical protein
LGVRSQLSAPQNPNSEIVAGCQKVLGVDKTRFGHVQLFLLLIFKMLKIKHLNFLLT